MFYHFYPRVLSRSWGCLSASSPIQSGLEVTQEVSRVSEVTHTRVIITGIASISYQKNRQKRQIFWGRDLGETLARIRVETKIPVNIFAKCEIS
jgi:hypothetical protein